MSLATALRETASDPSFVESLVALAEGIDLSDEGRASLERYAVRKRWGLLGLAESLDDAASEEDLYRCIASAWLEHRFEWQRYNMVLNYEAVRLGEASQEILVIAAACTGILERLEALLNSEDRERWATFAVELISGASTEIASSWGDESISLSPLS